MTQAYSQLPIAYPWEGQLVSIIDVMAFGPLRLRFAFTAFESR